MAINFRVFVFMDIFAAINFHELHSLTMQEQYVYMDFFEAIYFQEIFSCENPENNSHAKIDWFKVYFNTGTEDFIALLILMLLTFVFFNIGKILWSYSVCHIMSLASLNQTL